jgi:hypothetical protein
MSEVPHDYHSNEKPQVDQDLLARRASLLLAADFTKRWHDDTLRDSGATPQEKRQSRDRKREIIQRLVEFDEEHPQVAPPEEV